MVPRVEVVQDINGSFELSFDPCSLSSPINSSLVQRTRSCVPTKEATEELESQIAQLKKVVLEVECRAFASEAEVRKIKSEVFEAEKEKFDPYKITDSDSAESIFVSAVKYFSPSDTEDIVKRHQEKINADEQIYKLESNVATLKATLSEKEAELLSTEDVIFHLRKQVSSLEIQLEKEKSNSESTISQLQLQLTEKLFNTKNGAANELKLTEAHLRIIEDTNRDALARRDELISTLEERIVVMEHDLEHQTRKSHEKQLQMQMEMMQKMSLANIHSGEIVKQAEESLMFLEQANYATLTKKDEIISQYEKERRSIRQLAKLTFKGLVNKRKGY